jgi:hypothetical protein
VKAALGSEEWLGMGCSEGQIREAERPVRNRMVFMCRIPAGEPTGTKSHRTGVRVSIVAVKPGNAGGAKGHRKMDAS